MKKLLAIFIAVSSVCFSNPISSSIGARGLFAVSEGQDKPYDAEVEWIGQSSNGQYLPTGIVPPQGCVLRSEFQFTDLSQANALNIVGINYNGFGFGISGGAFKIDCFDFYTMQNVADDEWHVWMIDEPNYRLWLDGISVTLPRWHMPFASDWDGSVGFTLFRRTRASNGYSDFYTNKARVQSLYIGTSQGALFDGIAVRFTNEDGVSEGALYDRVSGQLFRNAGSGAFLIGPDL